MKSANPKEILNFAQQLHDSVSKLTHGEEVSELSSQGNIRFMMMKLTPHLQVKPELTESSRNDNDFNRKYDEAGETFSSTANMLRM